MKKILVVVAIVAAMAAVGPAFAQEPRLVYAPLVLSQALDLHSTHLALSRGASEGNPLMHYAAVRYTVKPFLTAVMIATAEQARAQGAKHAPFWVLTAISALQFGVDYHNYRIAGRLVR